MPKVAAANTSSASHLLAEARLRAGDAVPNTSIPSGFGDLPNENHKHNPW
jgi:hypothetical protein